MQILLAALALAPSTASAETYSFVWDGAGGYTMEGRFSYAPELVEGPFVRESDLSCFEIEGFLEGAPLGRWALGMLLPDTTWRFHFDPATGSLPVDGDDTGIHMPQAWNMNGNGDNCGTPGFGFNAGNFAQDLCSDGDLIEESQLPSATPFPAQPAPQGGFSADACHAAPLLGGLGADPVRIAGHGSGSLRRSVFSTLP